MMKIRILVILAVIPLTVLLGLLLFGWFRVRHGVQEQNNQDQPFSYWVDELNKGNLSQQARAQVVFREALDDPDESLRYQAAMLVLSHDDLDPHAASVLVQTVRSGDPQLRPSAARGLALVGEGNPHFPEALEVLVAALQDQDAALRSHAERALVLLGAEGKSQIPQLCELLSDRRPEVRRAAATVLGNMKGDARSALPHLRQAMKDEDPSVRQKAVEAIELIQPRPPA